MTRKKDHKYYKWVAVLLVLAFLLGMGRVLVNVERMDLAYRMENLQQEYRNNQELNTKLTIERNNLLSPYRLQEQGKQKGLVKPDEKQIREIRK